MTSKDPDDAPRPPRIIVPGQEPGRGGEPVVGAGGVPAASAPAAAGSRIILPPGTSGETDDDLPERPRVRPLVIVPVRDHGRDVLVITDPLGVLPAPVALRTEALELLQMLDGRTSLSDLSAELARASQDVRAGSWVREFVGELDRMLLLESPRFEAAYRRMRDEYHRLEIRQAALWGVSYPERPEEAGKFVDGHFEAAASRRAEAGEPVAPSDAVPRAVLAPHLDPRRAGPLIARAYLEIGKAPPGPLRVIVYGVGHQLWNDVLALTRKHFETPFGRVTCDTTFVDVLAERLGDTAYRSELTHRDEHSIEFQALYLRRRLGDRPFTIVPILVGGFHALLDEGRRPDQDPALETLIGAVRDTEARLGGRTVHVAGIDLAHVGPRFGDPAPDERVLGEIEAKDRAAMDAAVRGDASAWYDAIAEHEDSTRICGWGATYAMLRCAEPGAGRLLRYEASKEDDGTVVGVAAAVWG